MSTPLLAEDEFYGLQLQSVNQHLKPVYEEYQPFRFANVDVWPEIQDIVDSNSKGLDQLSIPYDIDANILVSLIAKQLHISFKVKDQPLSHMTVVHFMDQDTPHKALMSGFHYSREYDRLDDNRILHQVMINSPEELDGDMKRYFYAIQALLSDMLIRDIAYGYIATPEKMRVFSINKFLKANETQLNLKLSPAIVSSERYRVLLGMALYVHHKPPFLAHEDGVFVEPVQTTDPPVYALNTSEPSPALCKNWKNDNFMRFRVYKLCCHWKIGPSKPIPEFLYGVLRTDIKQGTNENSLHRAYSPVVLKYAPVIDAVASKALETEAMMYEYLMSKQCALVPTRVLYASLLDGIKVLCLEPFGRPLEPSDFPAAAQQVNEAIRSLHQRGIVHGNIRLENFYKKANKIVVANFDKAKLYNPIPPKLAAMEMKQVEWLCAQIRD